MWLGPCTNNGAMQLSKLPLVPLVLFASCASGQDKSHDCSFHRPGLVARLSQVDLGSSREIWSDALQNRRDRVPMARLSQRPSSDRIAVPEFDIAVFDDGLIVYSGQHCVKRRGIVKDWLTPERLKLVRTLIAEFSGLSSNVPNDEVCIEEGTIREVIFSDGERVYASTDRCHRRPTSDVLLARFAEELVERVGAKVWVGRPLEWEACGLAAKMPLDDRMPTRAFKP
jgi:hypothetical protein